MAKESDIALGFYQNHHNAMVVFHRFQLSFWDACACVHHHRDGTYSIKKSYLPSVLIGVLCGAIFTLIFSFFYSLFWEWSAAVFIASAAFFSVLIYYLFFHIEKKWIEKYKPLILRSETLIIVKVSARHTADALRILQEVEGINTITFLFRQGIYNAPPNLLDVLHEPITGERISERAMQAAQANKSVKTESGRSATLLLQLTSCEKKFNVVFKHLEESINLDQTATFSRDWLLDNSYVIQGKIREVHRNLPRQYYKELPQLKEGKYKGLPRVFAIADEIVTASACSIDPNFITEFLQEYQKITPLTIGELWAIPLMLSLCLVEFLEQLAYRVDFRLCEGEHASFWGNRLINIIRRDPEKLSSFLEELYQEVQQISPHFAEELLNSLYDEDTVLVSVRKWIEDRLKEPVQEIMQRQQLQETAEQTVLINAITSLIRFSQFNWRAIFESVSIVDEILRKDPIEVYSKMDFATRDLYRHAIEKIALWSHTSEIVIASNALTLAQKGSGDVERHIGYYLIDKGRPLLDELCHANLPFSEKFKQWIYKHPVTFYLGSLALLMVGSGAVTLSAIKAEIVATPLFFTILLLSLFPISEIGIQILNLLITQIFLPRTLPKMSFEEEGIPEKYRTFVVIPTLLASKESILHDVEELHIRFLANKDSNMKFGLFTDFLDAPTETMPEDQEKLDLVVHEIKKLNDEYGSGSFFLFHRKREWNPSEGVWMGWERKRGKLELLNRFLSGERSRALDQILYVGNREDLAGIVFVITLDADTQLPKDQAVHLVETLTHPLNKPYVSADGKTVIRGYTIIQPVVMTSLPSSNATYFSSIFADTLGTNPYAQTVSDVYQDLAGEGSYYGKGIYDLSIFNKILSGRFPTNHVLSHDLLEGGYVRTGLANDIVLTDSFPSTYRTFSIRMHRWLRGDWQISDWVLPYVPSSGKHYEKNPLLALDRWKIFDNLRRALLPAALLGILLLAWYAFPQTLFWPIFITFSLFIAVIVPFSVNIVTAPVNTTRQWRSIANGILRCLALIAFLPHQAYLSIDALFRFLTRRFISRKHHLEWTSSQAAMSKGAKAHVFYLKMLGVALFALLVAILLFWHSPAALKTAWPFLILWFFAPTLVSFLNKPYNLPPAEALNHEDRLKLRLLARWTWRYFDTFVDASNNWLPPDNFQDRLNVEVARRTSTTNIGLGLMSLISTQEFGYLTADLIAERLLKTLESLHKLEYYEGHFYNWYDTETLHPLEPRYVSTVDSGNLLACFWVLENALQSIYTQPVLTHTALDGIHDTLLQVVEVENGSDKELRKLEAKIKSPFKDLAELISHLPAIETHLQSYLSKIQASENTLYWMDQVRKQCQMWIDVINRYFTWVETLTSVSDKTLSDWDKLAPGWKREALKQSPSLHELFEGRIKGVDNFLEARNRHKGIEIPHEYSQWLDKLAEGVSKAQWLAGEVMGKVNQAIKDIRMFGDRMNMQFLYQENKKVFSIGYNVATRRLDSSAYDLLASEARLASLVAIAKGDVPVAHWWALGRPYGDVNGKKALLSWGGTMFEYLMPAIWTKYYQNSLLHQACHTAVEVQIHYGNQRGIPWGISEAAFSEIDAHKIYQYRSFGVPGLGLKRGLEKDLVVSPYSTALALMINPKAALDNFGKLCRRTHNTVRGEYGFYESIDFSRERDPQGERGVIIHTYMAHHQGMSLLAINNVLFNNTFQNYFHADPRVQSVESLLYERIPTSPTFMEGFARERRPVKLFRIPEIPTLGKIDTHESPIPKVNLLSNGKLSTMVTNAGGGYLHFGDFDVTRWRSDITTDSWGSFCYLKDLHSGKVWSTFFQPTHVRPEKTMIHFTTDKAEFQRIDDEIEVTTEIAISPEDNAEVRMVSIHNLSPRKREIELTSYLELALAPHGTDRAHPIFNKMFIETEPVEKLSGLLAFRRMRSPEDTPLFAAHCVTLHDNKENFEFETDRAKFLGRGGSIQYPEALFNTLTKSFGYVLDPIFSLRKKIVIEPGQQIEIAFTTLVTSTRDQAIALMEKYSDMPACKRAFDMAWTHAQLELRSLRIHAEDVQLFQKIASRILYPNPQLRASSDRLKRNTLGQSTLWAYGISGDLPIVIATINEYKDIDMIRDTLIAHSFWRIRGLKVDLLILNEEASSYERPLQGQLQNLIQVYAYPGELDKPSGIFLKCCDQIPETDLNLLFASASVVLIGSRGSLKTQVLTPLAPKAVSPLSRLSRPLKEEPSRPLPFMDLMYFNSIGGFTPEGKEYVIYLGPGTNSPAPWVNVISNPEFGVIVSESGIGSSWRGNGQTNRLTPWSNDPVLDPCSEVIYIYDEELNVLWSPTPRPIREMDAYRASHGQGYTRFEHNSHNIEQELLVFVPLEGDNAPPLKIQKLKLYNHSARKRTLTITSYTEWVLGEDRETTQMHLISEWDPESQSLFVRNSFNQAYSDKVAFASCTPPPNSFTADRIEFIGRNGTLAQPSALRRKTLLGKCGAALDQCCALQVRIELEPQVETELIFLMGEADNAQQARDLVHRYKDSAHVADSFIKTRATWDRMIDTIRFDTPWQSANLLTNRWLFYQTLSCRIWARNAFYQSSGAYGFRDQLQDSMTIVYARPDIAREQILRSARRQFLEGDVQHWWHPVTGAGVRTRISDDLLWLPFVTAHYVKVTGDDQILNEELPFLKGPLLQENEQEIYNIPEITQETASLLEHCRRSIFKGVTSGPHGLPLIGGGDWNDGMNLVGIHGKGESVWLTWFLVHTLNDFAALLSSLNQEESANGYRTQAQRLTEAAEAKAWDGAWYRRAYYDDGTPLGSDQSLECKIDSISQTWAVMSGKCDPARAYQALGAVSQHLVNVDKRLVLLLTPSFDKTELNPGYIKGYPPGVRENGGQYTHGSLWTPLAFARQGDGSQAAFLLQLMNPIERTREPSEVNLYKIEPYVLPGDVYNLPGAVGRGGWSWYTGSSGWMYRVWLEEIFGFQLNKNFLTINPVLPNVWTSCTLHYRYKSTRYEIRLENPNQINRGKVKIVLDGKLLEVNKFELVDDGALHIAQVLLED